MTMQKQILETPRLILRECYSREEAGHDVRDEAGGLPTGDRRGIIFRWSNPIRRKETAMEVIEAIHTRRSIRKYLDSSVPEESIQKLLAAAMQAPSARNQQPWQFVVIGDRSILTKIAELMPNAAMASKAPLGILVCGDLDLEKSEGYWVVDCAAAVENMLLAAHALGLGAVWCGVYPREPRMEGLKRLIGLPENVIAHSLVVVGYPAEQVRAENRYRAERVHRNRWAQ
jgi:nitroreductase